MAKTNTEKQQAFRARMKAEGRQEVRGIYAPPELHDQIKQEAKKLQQTLDKPAKTVR